MKVLTEIMIFFEQGGFWMWPILGFQLVSIAIIIERSIALFARRKPNQMNFVLGFEDNFRRGEMDSVISKADASKAEMPVARAIAAGANVAKNFGGKDEIQGKMDEVLLHENNLLGQRVGFLSMLGNVATLTGLLGTIAGMIQAFAAVTFANPADKATILAQGISVAMNTTAYGLIVAIPALVAFAILQNRANDLAEDMNQSALKVYNWLSYSYDPIVTRPTPNKGQRSPEANA